MKTSRATGQPLQNVHTGQWCKTECWSVAQMIKGKKEEDVFGGMERMFGLAIRKRNFVKKFPFFIHNEECVRKNKVNRRSCKNRTIHRFGLREKWKFLVVLTLRAGQKFSKALTFLNPNSMIYNYRYMVYSRDTSEFQFPKNNLRKFLLNKINLIQLFQK